MKSIIASCCLITGILLSFCFEANGQLVISGKVNNGEGVPVADATVILEAVADSAILKVEATDVQGKYSLTARDLRAVAVKVLAAGYESKRQVITDTIQPILTIDFTLTQKANELEAVTVASQKPLFERKTDRMIFNVANSLMSIGSSAFESVQRAPGVLYNDQSHSFNLAGKSGVQVMINGRLLQLSGEDLIAYLQAIPSENLERIEVITTPPAQYDAAGNSGLINIVLKKNPNNGLSGSVRLGYEQALYGTAIAGANLNYRKDKLSLYANTSYSDGAKRPVETMDTYFPGQVWEQTSPYKKSVSSVQATLGADYELHKKGVIGVQYTGSSMIRSDINNTDLEAIDLASGHTDSITHTDGTGSSTRLSHLLNVNYEWTIDSTGKKLVLNANKLWYNSDRVRHNETVTYSGDDGAMLSMSRDRNSGAQQIAITTAQIDLGLPYKWASISLGGKLSVIENSSNNKFLNEENGSYVEDLLISNEFDYQEQVKAGYVNVQKTIGKWSLQGGLRAEATTTEGYSRLTGKANTNAYLNLFPTVFISYTPNKNHAFNLNYSKRINRPPYTALDPYRFYTTPYSYIEGNPFVRPSYNHNSEVSYTLKNRYTFLAYYQAVQNHFGQVFFVDSATNGSVVSWDNFGRLAGYGLGIITALQPAQWWEVQVQFFASITELRSSYHVGSSRLYSRPDYYFTTTNNFAFNKGRTLLGEISVVYISDSQVDFFFKRSNGTLSIGGKALFFDKKLSLSLNASDILATHRFRSSHRVTGQTFDSFFDTRNVRIMLNYRFGNNKVRSRDRKVGIEEEKNRT